MRYKIKLILSGVCFLYFTTLIYSSYNKLVFDNFFGAILELITIPIIILTLIIYFIAIKDWLKESRSGARLQRVPLWCSFATSTNLLNQRQ